MHQVPPSWNTKTMNWWSFVKLYNVKALIGKPKTHSSHDVGWFSHQTHTNHNVGWFSPELTLTTMSGDFHPNSQSTITAGDFHLGTSWPPLLSGWKSPGVSIPGVWVIFAENWKWSTQTSAPIVGSWHVNLVLSCFDGEQVPQRCLVSNFMSSIKCFGLLPQVHAQQGASHFWLSH